jgi:ABC-2 type transport system ATP-binding protein
LVGPSVIRLHDVVFSYDGQLPALTVPSLEIDAGLTVVIGPNGAGKSTLLRMLAGVEAPKQGTITIDGADLWRDELASRRHLAFVPEYPELTPYATVIDVLRLVASVRHAPLGSVLDALEHVGLLAVGARTVRELSMGQRRRAMLATALLGQPSIVILDEPLETLDAEMRDFVRDWVFTRRDAGGTVIVATHDLASFAPRVDAALSVRGGTIIPHDLRANAPADRLARLELLARGHGDT